MERGERYNPLQEARELADNQVEQDFFDGKPAAEINEGVRERADQRQAQREAEREYAQERRETVDEVINSVVQLELEEFADRRLTPEQAKAEITQRLKELTTKLFSTEDDTDRDQLAVERAVLLRTRQALENDAGVREMLTRVEDAPDMPDVSFQQSIQYPRHDQDTVDVPLAGMGLNPVVEQPEVINGVRIIKVPERQDIVQASPDEVRAARARGSQGVERRQRQASSTAGDVTGVRPMPMRPPAEQTWINELPEQKRAE